MPEPALMIWILVAPLAIAAFDCVRTFTAIREGRKTSPAPGAWSNSLHVKGA